MRLPVKSDLLNFLASKNPRELKRMAALSIFVGITNTLLLGLINKAAQDVSTGGSVTWQFLGYAVLLLLFLFVTKTANKENIESANQLIFKFKIEILRDVFHSNLLKIDKIGRDHIMEVLSRDTQTVSQTIPALVSALQSFATLFFLIIYLAGISAIACIIILLAAVIIFYVGIKEINRLTDQLQQVAIREAEVSTIYGAFLSGYKEIKMHSGRAFDITQELITESRSVTEAKTKLILDITNYFNYLQVLLYLVVGLMVFVVPILSSDFSGHVATATTTALFLASSMTGVINNLPGLSMANVAARTLQDLAQQLASHSTDQVIPGTNDLSNVTSIALEHVRYAHSTSETGQSFVLGPISYTFEKSKVYFIRGNNGSGKTTLMRVLIGLYQSSSGRILINGEAIKEPATQEYRDQFSVVFNDFFLFDRLYGLKNLDPAEIHELLLLFKMNEKVSITNGRFTDLKFSTGQRKRLALIVAILEKKQFIILDEWAADQDPEFRQEFYEIVLPRLRSMGKTVIAITHDDQYYGAADQVIYLASGKHINQ